MFLWIPISYLQNEGKLSSKEGREVPEDAFTPSQEQLIRGGRRKLDTVQWVGSNHGTPVTNFLRPSLSTELHTQKLCAQDCRFFSTWFVHQEKLFAELWNSSVSMIHFPLFLQRITSRANCSWLFASLVPHDCTLGMASCVVHFARIMRSNLWFYKHHRLGNRRMSIALFYGKHSLHFGIFNVSRPQLDSKIICQLKNAAHLKVRILQ